MRLDTLNKPKAVLARRIARLVQQPAPRRYPAPPMTSAEWERLAPQVVSSGPRWIGATNGSGTRVLARIVQRCGLFIGTDLNLSSDAMNFAWFSDRWINTYVSGDVQRSAELRDRMVAEAREVVAAHFAERCTSDQSWGWKEPRGIFLLPFFN